jgi:hypothetical protein
VRARTRRTATIIDSDWRYEIPDWSLVSEIVEITDEICIIRAVIKDTSDRIIATGIGREEHGDGMVNKTSYVENCETSAWGRALGNLGIGIDASVASADEVETAISNQKGSF